MCEHLNLNDSKGMGLVHNCIVHLNGGGWIKILQNSIKMTFGFGNGYVALTDAPYVHSSKTRSEPPPKVAWEEGELARFMGYTKHQVSIKPDRQVKTDDYHPYSELRTVKHGIRSGMSLFSNVEHGA
jgi:hypothetical protein